MAGFRGIAYKSAGSWNGIFKELRPVVPRQRTLCRIRSGLLLIPHPPSQVPTSLPKYSPPRALEIVRDFQSLCPLSEYLPPPPVAPLRPDGFAASRADEPMTRVRIEAAGGDDVAAARVVRAIQHKKQLLPDVQICLPASEREVSEAEVGLPELASRKSKILRRASDAPGTGVERRYIADTMKPRVRLHICRGPRQMSVRMR
jgi:hypothetical protein